MGLPALTVIHIAVFSLLTFMVYKFDKENAKTGGWRTPENILHVLSLFGGWPGAFLAQHILRHKNKKIVFQLIFIITAIASSLAFYFLITFLKDVNLLSLRNLKKF